MFATGEIISGLGFFMLELLWLVTTGIALRKVLQKNFAAHRHLMIRSYAVTFAFVTFRLYLLPFTLHLTSRSKRPFKCHRGFVGNDQFIR
ncbi:DUF2306 domain-containing protein [Neobacillus sp. PS2-9]|uniref:DUF2306 domain-containing protein n=1 Tax=Neobacillus sp. PS2-9 TaxID=3070676 RepID=UPI0027E16EA8|nr:DUF2306 domain-containing protein [Neobacillus sp. PS2-9]WML56137.1 DUF2306 domain-containing protein [Neobacillus sp. PS2-9]